MSASFLAGPGGACLVGIGQQRLEVLRSPLRLPGRDCARRPATRRSQCARLQSVPGLFGFVGVDFIWDEEANQVTILEINPRPTTSFVGFGTALAGGMLAMAGDRGREISVRLR